MSSREKRIQAEAVALWRELYGDTPPSADSGVLLDVMLKRLPDVSYDRLKSPYLRRTSVTWPKRAG